jgi:hypothetical protein
MNAATLADWTTPQPFALPDLGPGLEGERRLALELALQSIAADPAVQALVIFGSRATGTARPESDLDLPVDLIVSGSADAARLAGSRWHVISEAARHGRVLVVRP